MKSDRHAAGSSAPHLPHTDHSNTVGSCVLPSRTNSPTPSPRRWLRILVCLSTPPHPVSARGPAAQYAMISAHRHLLGCSERVLNHVQNLRRQLRDLRHDGVSPWTLSFGCVWSPPLLMAEARSSALGMGPQALLTTSLWLTCMHSRCVPVAFAVGRALGECLDHVQFAKERLKALCAGPATAKRHGPIPCASTMCSTKLQKT